MFCCENCFVDPEIKAIISGGTQKGKCDFCHSENVIISKLEDNEYLKENFEELLDVYTPVNNIVEKYPQGEPEYLKEILHSQWSIFSLNVDEIYKFLVTLFPEKYKEQPELFDGSVGIAGSISNEYLNEYSVLGTYQWEDFVKEIKEKNRFHTNIINKDILKTIIRASCKPYKAKTEFYRARIWTENQGFGKEHMGAPLAKKASAGRANPEGISCLYLADSIDTTLYEIRAGIYDNVTVAKFILLEDVEIVDLATIDKISPFQEIDCSLLAINLPHLKKIGYEISKPLRRHDSSLDYLPTQYISDYIKSIGFAGIEYKSTMSMTGVNYAIFNEELFECVETATFDIDHLYYEYSKIQ